MEINPDHPVTEAMHDMWHKMVGLLMHRMGMKYVIITQKDIEEWARTYPDHAIVCHSHADAIELKIVTIEDAEKMAKEHGGLPN